MDTDEYRGTISASKAAVLMTARLGRVIRVDRLRQVLHDIRGGKGRADWRADWRVTPGDMDVLHGEILVRAAPWWRRSLVQSDRRAWVDGVLVRVPAGTPPWGQARGTRAGQALEGPAEWLPITEWPTGRIVGRLVLTDEVRDGYITYTRVAVPSED